MVHEKKVAIVNEVINTTKSLASLSKELPKKRIFPKRGNYRKRRAKLKSVRLQMALSVLMSAVNVNRIASSPDYSNYKEGGIPINRENALIGELILSPNSKHGKN
jgi:hypothetical protein